MRTSELSFNPCVECFVFAVFNCLILKDKCDCLLLVFNKYQVLSVFSWGGFFLPEVSLNALIEINIIFSF